MSTSENMATRDHPTIIQMAMVTPLPESPQETRIIFLSNQKKIMEPAAKRAIKPNAIVDEPMRYARKKMIGLIAIEIMTAIAIRAGSSRFLNWNKSIIWEHTYPGNTKTNGKSAIAKIEPKIS